MILFCYRSGSTIYDVLVTFGVNLSPRSESLIGQHLVKSIAANNASLTINGIKYGVIDRIYMKLDPRNDTFGKPSYSRLLI